MHRQKGLSLVGFILFAAVAALVVLVLFKALPVWSEYYAIRKDIAAVINEKPVTALEARQSFNRRAIIDEISSVKGDDLIIAANGEQTRISVNYQKIVPLFANVSLLFDFNAGSSTDTSNKP